MFFGLLGIISSEEGYGTLTLGGEFAPIVCVKHVLPTVLAVACTLTACSTTARRLDLYSPNKAQGPYTAELRQWTLAGRNNHQSLAYNVPVAEPTPPPTPGAEVDQNAPLPPPPPPPESTSPESDVGAPAATPVPQLAPAPMPVTPQAPPAMSAPAATPASDSDGGSNPVIPGLSQ